MVQLRVRLRARRCDDAFTLASATRPPDLARLLALARDRHYVVELGTGTGSTAIALAVDDRRRHVTSFDVVSRAGLDDYLALVGPQTRARIEFVTASGAEGPRGPRPVELLYIDSSHDGEETIAELRAWMPALADGALVVFDDYGHHDYPGVEQAVRQLGLEGERQGMLFVHRHQIHP